MSEEKVENPKLVFKDIEPVTGVLTVKLDCSEPVKTGRGKFDSDWFMWFGFVEHMTVHKGRKPNEEIIKDYTGKVLFFPTQRVNDLLVKAADGKVGAEVSVKHLIKQGAMGVYSEYEITKLSDGKVSGESLTPYEAKLVNDAKGLIANGYALTEETIVQSSKEDMYGGQISEARAKELYSLLANK